MSFSLFGECAKEYNSRIKQAKRISSTSTLALQVATIIMWWWRRCHEQPPSSSKSSSTYHSSRAYLHSFGLCYVDVLLLLPQSAREASFGEESRLRYRYYQCIRCSAVTTTTYIQTHPLVPVSSCGFHGL